MQKKMKRVEVRSTDNEVLLSFLVFEEEVPLKEKENPGTQPGQKSETKGEKKQAGNPSNSRNPQDQEPRITDAQQRYLFRLLADRGIEGDEALQALKEHFGVKFLKEVSKLEASRAIEQILEEAKVGGSR